MGDNEEHELNLISFKGVQLVVPVGLPFSYAADGTLTIDCSSGFCGKIRLASDPRLHSTSGTVSLDHQSGQVTSKQRALIRSQDVGHLAPLHAASPLRTEEVIPDSQFAPSLANNHCSESSPAHLQKQQAPQHESFEGPGSDSPLEDNSPKAYETEVLQAHESGLSSTPGEISPEQHTSAGLERPKVRADDPCVLSKTVQDDEDIILAKIIEEYGSKAEQPEKIQAPKPEADGSHPSPEKENISKAANKSRSRVKRKAGQKGATTQNNAGKRSSKKQKSSADAAIIDMCISWTALDCKGSLPDERWGASFTATGEEEVCLFAGNSNDEQLGDTWTLHAETWTWTPMHIPSAPKKAWHSAEFVALAEDKNLYAFGGERVLVPSGDATDRNSEEEEDDAGMCLSEVCQLDKEANMWVELPISGKKLERSGHTTTLLPDGRILLFGGIDNDGRYCNDAHLVDLHHLNCFSITGSTVKGPPPKPRAYHTATLVGNSVVVLGGTGARPWSLKEVYSLSVDNWQWREHTAVVEGEAPAPRSGHTAVALPGGRFLLVYGGGVPENDVFFSTVAILDTHKWTWISPQQNGAEKPRARSGHGMALIKRPTGGSALVMFGGRTHDETLCQDTWLLELEQPLPASCDLP